MDKTCTATEGCEKPAFRRGWCSMHYERWKVHGDFTTVKKPGGPRRLGDCPVDDGKGPCGRPAIANDLCAKHYQRWKKFGDPLITKLDRDRTPEDRFWSFVNKDGPVLEFMPELGPCWLWTGGTADGYGAFSLPGRRQEKAHRTAYRWLNGEIPEGLQLDHVCHSLSVIMATCAGGNDCLHRRCVNPAHLEPVTALENLLRGLSPHAVNAAKTRCPQDHEYNEANTRINNKGQRICIPCARARCLAWYYRQKAGAA